MAKKIKSFLKRYLPHPKQIKDHQSLQVIKHYIQDPNLWHLNRHSVATAFSVGLFFAFIPIPFQMLSAAILAIFFRANLPISVALTWVTNPLTTLPVIGFNYYIGATLLGRSAKPFKFEPTLQWLIQEFDSIGVPLLFGCLIVAISAAILGNVIIRVLWRYWLVQSWQHRSKKRKKDRR